MNSIWLRAGALALLTTCLPLGSACAHCIVGNRFFPATLNVDDPCVADDGIIYVGKTYQVGVEAIVPINRDSGGNVGMVGQSHLYLDDMFPNGIGRPIFATGMNTTRTSQ